jgi:hypothetical protein
MEEGGRRKGGCGCAGRSFERICMLEEGVRRAEGGGGEEERGWGGRGRKY